MSSIRFSLSELLLFTLVCCLVLGFLVWDLVWGLMVVPGILGPYAAYKTEPSKTSAVLGFFSGYFWSLACIPLQLFLTNTLLIVLWLPFKWPIIITFVLVPSLVGGYLAARVERTRLEYQRRYDQSSD